MEKGLRKIKARAVCCHRHKKGSISLRAVGTLDKYLNGSQQRGNKKEKQKKRNLLNVRIYKKTTQPPKKITANEKNERNITKRNDETQDETPPLWQKRKTNHFPLELDFALCALLQKAGGAV